VSTGAQCQACTRTSDLAIASIKSRAPGGKHRNSPEESTTSSPPPSAVIQRLPDRQVILPPLGKCARSTIPLPSGRNSPTTVASVCLRPALHARRIARRTNPSPATELDASSGVRVRWTLAAGTPLDPWARGANVCRPLLRTAPVISAFSHQLREITDSENKLYTLYRFAEGRICYALKKQELCIAVRKQLCYSVQ
jgi:hypothetical protein